MLGGIARTQPEPTLRISADAHALLRHFGDRLTWVEPLLVAEVRHLGARSLDRCASQRWLGCDPDIAPADLFGSIW